MAEKIEKKTTSQKVNSVLEKNRKVLIIVLVIAFVALIGFIVWNITSTKIAEKNISELDTISYELTNGSSSLEAEELSARINTAKENTIEKSIEQHIALFKEIYNK